MTYKCPTGDDTHTVTQLLTNLTNGQVLPICAEEAPVAFIGMLAAELDVDYARLYDAIKKFADREQKSQLAKAAKEVESAATTGPIAECPQCHGTSWTGNAEGPRACLDCGHVDGGQAVTS